MQALEGIVRAALDEDLADLGDITTDAVIPAGATATGHIVAREALTVAGLPVARAVFQALDAGLDFREGCADGDRVDAGACVATLIGNARAILRGERTALNFLMRMCGIAGAAAAAVREIRGTRAQILDTRKTAPGLRLLDKYAVAAGGGLNHRFGLYDAVMIKDTHLAVVASIRGGVAAALAHGHPAERITVEVESLEQLAEAIDAGAGRALLDNLDLATLREAVLLADGRIVCEASGGLRPGRLRAVAETGVDFLSLGYLTHSVAAADLALEVEIGS